VKTGYEYLEHTADVGLRSWGRTLSDALASGAQGLFALMVDLESVIPVVQVDIECQADDPAALYVELLNELLAQRDIEGMFFCCVEIERLEQNDIGWRLSGLAKGEKMDLERHMPQSDVKAATYGGLAYTLDDERGHVLQCVLDV